MSGHRPDEHRPDEHRPDEHRPDEQEARGCCADALLGLLPAEAVDGGVPGAPRRPREHDVARSP